MSARAEQFHASPWIGVLYITGGGSSLIEEMLGTAGASASILEVQVPYASQALTELIGRAPEQACSSTTARQLAIAAYERAQALQADSNNFGFGCTASLATNRTKKGQHRAHWAIQTAAQTHVFSMTFNADRAAEEVALVEQIWATLQEVLLQLPATTTASAESHQASADELRLYQPELARFCRQPHEGKLILPGSFNPLHDGHRQMLAISEQLTGLAGAYEITVRNADKPPLDFLSLHERQAQFADTPLWLTNAATYADKSLLFPGVTFALGVDTLARIAQVRFYDDREERLLEAMQTFAEQNVRFLVFGRMAERYLTLADLELPPQLRALCQEVTEDEFRMDISSTELRQAGGE